jgi:CRISPR/Cas system-associated exonuclease Cas4 (RecB family)
MLKGLICAVTKEIVEPGECIECAENNEIPECNYTPSIIRNMIKERMDEHIHITDLTTCTRQKILKRKIPYTEKLDNLYFKLRGTGLHLAIEFQSTKNLLTEFDVDINIDNEKIVGRIDEIDIKNKILRDYKTSEEPPRHPYLAHQKQVNLYKYCYEKQNNDEIKSLEIIYMTLKGVRKFQVNIEPREEIEKFLKDRVKAIIEGSKKITDSIAEFGPLCKYCPEEVKRYCRAIEIRKWLKEIANRKKIPSIEEILAEMPADLYSMD